MKEIVANLEVHPERMVANLRLSHGSTMSEAVSAALTEYVGRDSAHALVEGATRKAMLTQTTLLDVMTADAAFTAHISANELERLLQPENYLGSTKALISRAIKSIADKES
jgi:3-carboxy-cis,cis-muconate cycloisomerase